MHQNLLLFLFFCLSFLLLFMTYPISAIRFSFQKYKLELIAFLNIPFAVQKTSELLLPNIITC